MDVEITHAHIKLWGDNAEPQINVLYKEQKIICLNVPVRYFMYNLMSIYNTKFMKDFIFLADGCNITEIEQINDIPEIMTKIFVDICKQISNRTPIYLLTDIQGNRLTEIYPIYKCNNQDKVHNSVRNELKDFVTNIATSVLCRVGNELIQPTGVLTNSVNNNRFEASTRISENNYVQQLTTPSIISMLLARPIQNRLSELDRKEATNTTRNMISNIVSNSYNNSHFNNNEHIDYNFGNDYETNLPNRFTEVANDSKEVIITNSNDSKEVIITNSNDSKEVIITNSNDLHLEQKENIEKNIEKNKTNNLLIQQNVNLAQLPPVLPQHKKINIEIIKKTAIHVCLLIKDKKTKPPKFDNLSRSGMRKIKNYLYNISHIWFSHDDVMLFIEEIKKI